jgi:hypothetical protein
MMHDDDINDLLCFYDSRKSQKVTHCCEILAELLEAFWGDGLMSHESERL